MIEQGTSAKLDLLTQNWIVPELSGGPEEEFNLESYNVLVAAIMFMAPEMAISDPSLLLEAPKELQPELFNTNTIETPETYVYEPEYVMEMPVQTASLPTEGQMDFYEATIPTVEEILESPDNSVDSRALLEQVAIPTVINALKEITESSDDTGLYDEHIFQLLENIGFQKESDPRYEQRMEAAERALALQKAIQMLSVLTPDMPSVIQTEQMATLTSALKQEEQTISASPLYEVQLVAHTMKEMMAVYAETLWEEVHTSNYRLNRGETRKPTLNYRRTDAERRQRLGDLVSELSRYTGDAPQLIRNLVFGDNEGLNIHDFMMAGSLNSKDSAKAIAGLWAEVSAQATLDVMYPEATDITAPYTAEDWEKKGVDAAKMIVDADGLEVAHFWQIKAHYHTDKETLVFSSPQSRLGLPHKGEGRILRSFEKTNKTAQKYTHETGTPAVAELMEVSTYPFYSNN